MKKQKPARSEHRFSFIRFSRILAVLLGLCSTVTALEGAVAGHGDSVESALTLEGIARDWEEWAGMPPSRIRWSPDGKMIQFDWNPERQVLASLYEIAPSGEAARQLTPEERRFVPPPEPTGSHTPDSVSWNPSRSAVVFARQGDIFFVDAVGGDAKRLTDTQAIEESPRFTHDESGVTFQVGNNLFLYEFLTGGYVELTNFAISQPSEELTEQEQYLAAQQLELFEHLRENERVASRRAEMNRHERGRSLALTRLQSAQRISDMSLAPNGDYVVFSLVDDTRLEETRTLDYPAYVTKSGYVEVTATKAVKPTETFREYRLGFVDVSSGEAHYIDSTSFGKPVSWNPVVWSPDGKSAVAWAGSLDHKDLWLCVIDFVSETTRVLFHEHEDAWVRGFRAGRFQRGDGQVTGFLPDGRTVYFLSEQDGWYHLYTVAIEGGKPHQLTSGEFEVTQPRLSQRGDRWYLLSNEGDLLQRHLYTMPLAGGARVRLTPGEGWVDEYAVAPDEKHIAYTYADPMTPPELFVMKNRTGAEAVQLTQSMSEEFRGYPWQRPKYVTFSDSDGWPVYGELYAPSQANPTRPTRAALIHVHGTGWTQGVAKRFGGYMPETRVEFQFLTEHGYTVLSVDYKGSRGYGRESRISVYRHMGEPELESVDAAIEFLVEKHSIDRRRVGIYGHSYGGYLTLMGLLTRPGTFAAGAAQAPVADNAHSPTFFFMTRLLNVPWQDDEAYRRSSPIYYADHLQDRLLILHGLEDYNVPVQGTFRLTQRFIELKKTGWDLAIYPVESHVFHAESARLDMLRRRFALFESALKAPTGSDRTN